MKTPIKNLFVAALTIVALSSASVVTSATEINSNRTALTHVKNINKIVVNGNVKLILVQDNKESVEVYDQYYSKNALVQQQGNELRISSFDKNTLTVIAHINNLSSIEASNTSTVSTSGKFNLLNLNVILKDQASAEINANTVSLSTMVKDSANLKLEGSTDDHTVVMGSQAKLKMEDFRAENTTISTTSKAVLASNNTSRYDDLKISLLEKLF